MKSNPNCIFIHSYHEIGTQDLPAILDTILRTTGHKQLSYVGHSMGTTEFFVMGSERPELMQNIRVFIGLSPVAAFSPLHVSREKAIILNFVSDILVRK